MHFFEKWTSVDLVDCDLFMRSSSRKCIFSERLIGIDRFDRSVLRHFFDRIDIEL